MSRLENTVLEMRHHFIYGRDGEERSSKLKAIADNNPIVVDQDKPMGIYLDSVGLPKVDCDLKGLDKDRLDTFAREYLGFVIFDNLLERFRESVDVDKEVIRISNFLKRMNNLYDHNVSTIDEYAKSIKTSRDAFLEAYMKYVRTGEMDGSFIEKLDVPFMMIEFAIKKFKEMLNNKSFFAIIADSNGNLPYYSCRAINNLVCSRINADISMNVATDPNNWGTYWSQNGQLAEYVHDYGVIELDNSLNEQVKKLKKQYNNED